MIRGKPVSLLLVLTGLVIVGSLGQGCVTAGEYERVKGQLAKANETIDLKDQRIEELDHERLVYEEEALALRDELARYRQNVQEADGIIADLKKQLQAPGQSGTMEGIEFFSPDAESVGIRVADEILFDSGSDSLKSTGKNLLEQLVKNLKDSGKKIKIVGHTDTDPVVKTKNKYPHGNIQLSTERAISVYDFLKSKGVPEPRMIVEGHGPHSPLVENNSPVNKQKNRRVEIILTN